jgi:hypothetical protein
MGLCFRGGGGVNKVRIENEGEIVRRVRRRGRASPRDRAWISDGGSRELVPSMILVLGSVGLVVFCSCSLACLGHRAGHLLGVGKKHLTRWPDDKQLIPVHFCTPPRRTLPRYLKRAGRDLQTSPPHKPWA